MASAEETARRIEAARAYAGITNQRDLEKRIGFKAPKFNRYLAGEGPGFSPDDLVKIADECGVPSWFLLAGWDGWQGVLTQPGADEADLEARSGEELEGPETSDDAQDADEPGQAGASGS